MDLDRILEHNRSYVRGRTARPLPPVGKIQRAVLACYDPRLDELILPSLGMASGEVFLLRAAGALLYPGSPSLRSLSVGIYMFGVTEVFVVGHTSCRMAQFSSAGFIEAFRGRGVSRDAFGEGDLRVWAGAIPTPEWGVRASVAELLDAPYVPSDVRVAGLVLDDTTGELDLVVPPGERPVVATPAESEPTPTEPEPTPTEPEPEPAPEPAKVPLAKKVPVARGDAFDQAVDRFASVLASKAEWIELTRRLGQDIASEKDGFGKLRRLDRFVRNAAVEWRELGKAYDDLKDAANRTKRRLDVEDVMKLLVGRMERR